MSLADLIVNKLPPTETRDNRQPRMLRVDVAEFGVVESAPRDPLLLSLGNVEPGTTIELLNLSAKPDADWDSDRKSLGAIPVMAMPRGGLLVRLTDEEAAALGIEAGDVIELRQVDAAGNASDPVQIRLPNYAEEVRCVTSLPAVDAFLGSAPVAHDQRVMTTRARDTRAVVVLPANMSLGIGSNGAPELSGKRCLEPGARVQLRNERTGADYSAIVDARGSFSLPFAAELGDPITVFANDDIQSVALGTLIYAPVLSASQARTGAAG